MTPTPSVREQVSAGAAQQQAAVTRGLGAGLAWPGLLRKLDRDNPGYRL